MPMPRIAHQVQWSNEEARRPDAGWGCWDCGNEDSRVRDTDKDAEHIRVRLRECTRCGSTWETEERRIGRGAYFGRAERRRYAAFRKSRFLVRRCLMCDETYMQGDYRAHTETSEAHRARVAVQQRRNHERERRYRRLHAQAARAVERATRGTAVCQRCGERYDLSVKFAARVHRGSSPVHKQVVRDEAAARRDRRRQAERHRTALRVAA